MFLKSSFCFLRITFVFVQSALCVLQHLTGIVIIVVFVLLFSQFSICVIFKTNTAWSEWWESGAVYYVMGEVFRALMQEGHPVCKKAPATSISLHLENLSWAGVTLENRQLKQQLNVVITVVVVCIQNRCTVGSSDFYLVSWIWLCIVTMIWFLCSLKNNMKWQFVFVIFCIFVVQLMCIVA